MAKFYCRSGEFKTIIDASNETVVISKFVNRLLRQELCNSLLLWISEQGFDDKNTMVCSLIPTLREIGVFLPSDDVLIQSVCEILNIPSMDTPAKQWLLNGGFRGF